MPYVLFLCSPHHDVLCMAHSALLASADQRLNGILMVLQHTHKVCHYVPWDLPLVLQFQAGMVFTPCTLLYAMLMLPMLLAYQLSAWLLLNMKVAYATVSGSAISLLPATGISLLIPPCMLLGL